MMRPGSETHWRSFSSISLRSFQLIRDRLAEKNLASSSATEARESMADLLDMRLIDEICTSKGFMYLFVIIDLYSRYICQEKS
jgi:hypothetical protein